MKKIFQYASLLAAAVMLIACEGNEPVGELTISSDKNLIQTFGGDYATLTVKLGTQVVKEDVTFYDGNNEVLEVNDFKFATDKAGVYEIWASYGTYISDKISIMAIDVALPDTPKDPQPENTKFKVRSLLTEFTTTGCSWCPSMKRVLHEALADAATADQVVVSACHSSLVNSVADPAYIKTDYEDFSKSTGMPYAFCDMYYGFGYYQTLTPTDLRSLFSDLVKMKEDIAPGIAVAARHENDNIVAKVTIKASKTASYRVGAFLLEDGVKATQYNAGSDDWMHTHDNVIRYIDAQTFINGKSQFYGYPIGEVQAGKTGDYVFSWILNDIWENGSYAAEVNGGGMPWAERNDSKLHMAVFVCAVDVDEKGNQFYRVVNAIDCPVNGDTKFEYR